MIFVLSIAVLITAVSQTVMVSGLWKLLRKIDRSVDRIIESLDELRDLIKPLTTDEHADDSQ